MPNISRRPRCSSFSKPACHAQLRRDRPQAGARYALIERTLRGCQYPALSKKDKGIVRRYLAKISGLSRSQITRLIARWRERGVLEPRASRRRRFPRRYTPDDITLLARVDAAHEGLSAPAIRRILERECKVYGKTAYQRLAAISSGSHIYNLRRTRAYREHHVHHTKTRAAAVSIGERRKPDPGGRPGYLSPSTRCIRLRLNTPPRFRLSRDCIVASQCRLGRHGQAIGLVVRLSC